MSLPSTRLARRRDVRKARDAPHGAGGFLRFAPMLDASKVDGLQRAAMATPNGANGMNGTSACAHDDVLQLVAWNHRCNRLLWAQEDLARRADVPDAWIVQNKRAIDRHNQERNDAIETMDELLLDSPHTVPPRADAWLNSETAGSIIDRLSINLLKQHHLGQQAARGDATAEHRERCSAKLACLQSQRDDLLQCLQCLLDGLRDGRCTFRLYRQFKMYNDPSLNPHLRGAAARGA